MRKTSRVKGADKRIENRSSAAGFSFANLYLNCQWKWFIRYMLAIEPLFSAPALIAGTAFHAGRAAFIESKGDTDEALEAIARAYADKTVRLEEDSMRVVLERRTREMLTHWINAFGRSDFDRYEFIAVEKYLEAPVPGLPGFVFTGRIDDIRRRKEDGKVLVFDAKTSGFSEEMTADSFQYGDQATAYSWLVGEALGIRIDAVVPDIVFWYKGSDDPKKIRCTRPVYVHRTPEDIEQFKLSTMQLYSEMAQKYEAVENGADPRALFHRNTMYCKAFNRPCEFADVCRSRSILTGTVSPAFFAKGPKRPIEDIHLAIDDALGQN